MEGLDPGHVTGTQRKAKKRSRGEPADSSQAEAGKQRVKRSKQRVKRREQRDPELWLPDLGLTMEDKKDLQGTGMIHRRVVKAAVLLLKQQFQDATGLPCIRAVEFNVKPTRQPTVQIHVDLQHHHAFVTACDGTTVLVADSVSTWVFGDMAIQQIEGSYKSYVEEPLKNMEYLQVDQQTYTIGDIYSCVLHSIANAYELLAEDGSTECVYNRERMRPHLLQCFINRKITEFPKDLKIDKAQQPLKRPFNWKT